MSDQPTAYDQFLLDVFCTALEGGIGYWSECSAYHWMIGPPADDIERPSLQDHAGFYADIVELYELTNPDDDDSGTRHRINRVVMADGLRRAATVWRDQLRWSTEPPPLVVTDDTDWDFDAGDADMIVQLGLFGEVRYG